MKIELTIMKALFAGSAPITPGTDLNIHPGNITMKKVLLYTTV